MSGLQIYAEVMRFVVVFQGREVPNLRTLPGRYLKKVPIPENWGENRSWIEIFMWENGENMV